MEWNLKLTGILLVLVSLMHIGFSARFDWKRELAQLTLINRQMMIVHTFFVAFVILLMGLLCLFYPAQLTETPFGRIVSGGLFVFWLLRLICQFFVYSPTLWKGKRFETRMHWLFAGIWTYVTIVFLTAAQSLPSIQHSRAWQGKPQTVPGRIQCELYDEGGEGVAYHDSDAVNHGSGMLNPANGSYLNEFRMKEGVDISYTKSGDIDNNAYNFVNPEMGQLYVGWTVPGEWIRLTITVTKPATYRIGLMYTANTDGAISLSADGKDIAGKISVPTTHRNADTVAWRQWHHWNKAEAIAKINLSAGTHVLTLHSISGNMNYDYLEFTETK